MNEKQKRKNFKEMWIFHEKKEEKKNRERMRKMKGKSEIIMNERKTQKKHILQRKIMIILKRIRGIMK